MLCYNKSQGRGVLYLTRPRSEHSRKLSIRVLPYNPLGRLVPLSEVSVQRGSRKGSSAEPHAGAKGGELLRKGFCIGKKYYEARNEEKSC